MVCTGDEYARVPVELATLHKHSGKVALRFLGKRFHLIYVGLATQVAQLDISVAWLWSGGANAHCQQHPVLRYIAYAYINAVGE